MTLDEHLAQAIAQAFWETAERPRAWASHSPQEQQVWRLCGTRAVEAARAFKADLTFVCQAKSFQRLVDGGYGEDAEPLAVAAEPPAPADIWRRRVAEFAGTNRYWNRLDWGPPPGKEGCTVSPEIQREFGIEPAKPQAIGTAA